MAKQNEEKTTKAQTHSFPFQVINNIRCISLSIFSRFLRSNRLKVKKRPFQKEQYLYQMVCVCVCIVYDLIGEHVRYMNFK